MWLVFGVAVAGMLVLDLGVFHRRAHKVSIREALVWSAVWIALALLFALGVWYELGKEPALEFLTGYIIEKSLSVDNLFVFLVIFSYFGVSPRYQHKVLFWGILSALVFRAVFIAAGVTLIRQFHWVIYVFGVFLVYSGVKLFFQKDHEIHPEQNPVLRLLRRFRRLFPITKRYLGGRFLFRRRGAWVGTPLLVVLIMIEPATSSSPWTRSPPSWPSPPTRSWYTPPTCSPSWACAPSTSPWPASWRSSTTCTTGWPSSWRSSG